MKSAASENKHIHGHEACTCGHGHHDHEACTCGHGHHDHEVCTCGHRHHDHEACTCGHGHHDHGHEACTCGHEHHDHCACGHEHHDHEACTCGHGHHGHEACTCGHNHHSHDDHAHDHTVPKGEKVYILNNLGCANCAAKMEAKIRALPGVQAASITFATRQLRISAKDCETLLPQIRRICAEIESQVTVTDPDEHKQGHLHDHNHEEMDERREKIEIIIGAALFALVVILEHAGVQEWMVLVLSLIGYLILGGRILMEAIGNLRRGHVLDENFLMSIATIGAFLIRNYPEAMGVMLFYRVGEYFEHKAVEKSRSQIMQAVDMRPEVVNRLQGDEMRVIPAGEAEVGDILLIRPGDRIPLDGIIVEGESRLDTSPITGEPVPVSVAVGDRATSGCVNTSGQLKLRVEKPLSESMVSRILDCVENAAAGKPKIDRFITRFARIYTPCVVIIALATAVIPSLVSGNWNYWVYTALTFLVMSCPCALVLSVPLAFFSGIGAGSRRSILFKGGAAIEAMGKLKVVVMDKTGTITRGDFRLQSVISAGKYAEGELLAICASCEQNSTHPIAHSIVAAAREQGISLHTPERLHEIAGHGIEAILDNKAVLCGNRKLMQRYNVSVDASTDGHGSQVYVAIDGKYAGLLVIADTIKPDASAAISRLKQMGLKTVMLTGDSEESAAAVARETGVDRVHARLLPEDKMNVLQQLRKEYGPVMFVGDGINDAPVLAGADVGAAMGSGADAAIEAADAVFMTTAVQSVPESIRIARGTGRIAVQNVVFALAVKIIVMILGLCGWANMWLAVFADTGVAMLCVLNSIRALYKK